MAKIVPLCSSSKGNSVFIGDSKSGVLVDCGCSFKALKTGLDKNGIPFEAVRAVLVTHEHIDHVKGAGVFSRKFDVPIYATMETWDAMEGSLGKIAPRNKRFVYEGEPCVINDLCVKPFAIPHDAAAPVGYSVFAGEKKITVATDIGHVTDTIRENITDSDILLLESNHDEEMVKKGRYPWNLKQRILGERGHLSNRTAGALLAEIMSGKMKHIFLGHLSEENNSPYLAYETVAEILEQNRIKLGGALKMDMAARNSNGAKVTI